jgi:hypothetical protein
MVGCCACLSVYVRYGQFFSGSDFDRILYNLSRFSASKFPLLYNSLKTLKSRQNKKGADDSPLFVMQTDGLIRMRSLSIPGTVARFVRRTVPVVSGTIARAVLVAPARIVVGAISGAICLAAQASAVAGAIPLTIPGPIAAGAGPISRAIGSSAFAGGIPGAVSAEPAAGVVGGSARAESAAGHCAATFLGASSVAATVAAAGQQYLVHGGMTGCGEPGVDAGTGIGCYMMVDACHCRKGKK